MIFFCSIHIFLLILQSLKNKENFSWFNLEKKVMTLKGLYKQLVFTVSSCVDFKCTENHKHVVFLHVVISVGLALWRPQKGLICGFLNSQSITSVSKTTYMYRRSRRVPFVLSICSRFKGTCTHTHVDQNVHA